MTATTYPRRVSDVLASQIIVLPGGARYRVLRSRYIGQHTHALRLMHVDSDNGYTIELPSRRTVQVEEFEPTHRLANCGRCDLPVHDYQEDDSRPGYHRDCVAR